MGQVLIFPVASLAHWFNYQLIKNLFLEVLFLWPKVFVKDPGKAEVEYPWVCIECIRGFLWWLVKSFIQQQKINRFCPSCVWLIDKSWKYSGGPSWCDQKHPLYWNLAHTHEETPSPWVIKRVSGDTGHDGDNQWPGQFKFYFIQIIISLRLILKNTNSISCTQGIIFLHT